MKSTEQITVLQAFHKVLGQELHNIRKRPDILWQQMYNRLQWKHKIVHQVLELELLRRSTTNIAPWIHTCTPFREAEALLRTLPHQGVQACALARDGALLCSAGDLIRLWDTRTGTEVAMIDVTGDPIVSCDFDYNKNFLITGSKAGKVQIRDAENLATLVELHMDNGEAYCAISPVEPLAVIASSSILRIIELPTGSKLLSSSVNEGLFTCCAFSKDGKMIATGDNNGIFKLWNASTLDLYLIYPSGVSERKKIKTCAFSPDLAFTAIVYQDSDAVLLLGGPDDEGKPQTMTLSHIDKVNDCTVSPDGRWLTFVSDDNMIWLQELRDLKLPLSVMEGHTAPVVKCMFSFDGSVFATASKDGTVKLWDQLNKTYQGGIIGHHGRVTSLDFSLDGSFIVSASADMTLKKWDPAATDEQGTFEGHMGPVWDCVVFKGSNLIASAGADSTIRFWDAQTGKETLELHVDDVYTMGHSPDEYLLATGDSDSMIKLWDIASGNCLRKGYIGGGCIQDCVFTEDGKRILLACEDGTLRLWEVASWRELAILRGHTNLVSCCDVVHNSSLAVSGGQDGTLRLWDLDSGKELHAFYGHTDAVWDCSVSVSGAILVSVAWDGQLRIWDIPSKKPIAEFSFSVRLRSVAIHPSKPRVACGDYNGLVHVVNIMGINKVPYIPP